MSALFCYLTTMTPSLIGPKLPVFGIFRSAPFVRFLGTVQDTAPESTLVYTVDADGNVTTLDDVSEAVEWLASHSNQRPDVATVGTAFTRSPLSGHWYRAPTDQPPKVREQTVL